jgi:hypothetical protein
MFKENQQTNKRTNKHRDVCTTTELTFRFGPLWLSMRGEKKRKEKKRKEKKIKEKRKEAKIRPAIIMPLVHFTYGNLNEVKIP